MHTAGQEIKRTGKFDTLNQMNFLDELNGLNNLTSALKPEKLPAFLRYKKRYFFLKSKLA